MLHGSRHRVSCRHRGQPLMTANDSAPPPPPFPPPLLAVPIDLSYSNLRGGRPGIITAIGVVGIIIAVFGFLASLYGVFQAWSSVAMGSVMPAMRWATGGALTVTLSESFVGAALAAALLTGS